MENIKKALPAEGSAKPVQIPEKAYETVPRDRPFLAFTAAFCVLLADSLLWYGPTAGLELAVFLWCALLAALRKIRRPAFSFCSAAFPLLLAG